jgi:hypothetical protein
LNALGSGSGVTLENLRYLGPEAFGEYGNFAIYAGTQQAGIRFGVRLDGTLYSSRGQFENVKITGGAAENLNIESSTGSEWSSTYSNKVSIKILKYTNLASSVYEIISISAGGSIYITNG